MSNVVSWGKKWLPLLLLVLTTFAVYADIFDHRFIMQWDDDLYVLKNEALRGFTSDNLKAVFSSCFVGNYAPVHLLSYMLDYLLWGLNPAGYLFLNVLIHATNGGLFFVLLRRLRQEEVAAFAAAAIFLLHPVQVESVAWISQRKNVLAMLFFLVAFHLYVSYREQEQGRVKNYCLSLGALVLALLTKSVTMIFPLVLICYDLCLGERRSRRFPVADKILPAAAAVAVALVAMLTQTKVKRSYPGGNFLAALYSMLPVPAAYLRDFFFPVGLSPHYMVTIRQQPDGGVLFAASFLLFLLGVGVVLFRKNRRLLFFLALFFIGLLPVSQIVPFIPLKNDRYLYFPLLGLAGLAGEALTLLWRAYPRRQKIIAVISILLLFPLPVLSFRQTAIWKDELTLWGHAVRLDRDNQLGWLMLMKAHTLRGNGAEAREAAENFARLKEKYGPLRGWEHE